MMRLEKSPQHIRLGDDRWVFEFRLAGDRWQHAVLIAEEGELRPVLVSAEGDPTGDPLPSPAYQDLRFESLADNDCEFQVMGQSGKGIYTAAIRCEATRNTFDFDICARGRKGLESLCTASTYRVVHSVREVKFNGNAGFFGWPAVLQESGFSLKIEPVPIEGTPAIECRWKAEAGEPCLAIGHFDPTGLTGSGRQISVRWRYRLSVGLELPTG